MYFAKSINEDSTYTVYDTVKRVERTLTKQEIANEGIQLYGAKNGKIQLFSSVRELAEQYNRELKKNGKYSFEFSYPSDTDVAINEVHIRYDLNGSNVITVIVPDFVTIIKRCAFYGRYEISKVILSNSLVVIEGNAFLECKSLQAITIPKNVTELGTAAFEDCIQLETVKICGKIEKVGISVFRNTAIVEIDLTNLPYLTCGMFANCKYLKSVILPEKAWIVPFNCFSCCSELEEIDLKNTTLVDGLSFNSCWNLKEVTALHAEYIAKSAMAGCSHISFNVSNSCHIHPNVYNEYTCREYPIITADDRKQMLYEIEKIEKAYLKQRFAGRPDLVIDIDDSFESCIGVRRVCEKTADIVQVPEGVVALSSYCFDECDIKKLKLPNTLQYIHDGGISNLSSLTELDIPDSVVYMGNNAIWNVYALKRLKLSRNCIAVESNQLRELYKLEELDISGVKYIFSGAFKDMHSLHKVTFSRELRLVQNSAFVDCHELQEVTIPKTCELERNAFPEHVIIKYFD